MTPEERKTLAEQLNGNPLFHDILARIEKDATEALIFATTEQARIEAQTRVKAARSFREDCLALLSSDQPRGSFA